MVSSRKDGWSISRSCICYPYWSYKCTIQINVCITYSTSLLNESLLVCFFPFISMMRKYLISNLRRGRLTAITSISMNVGGIKSSRQPFLKFYIVPQYGKQERGEIYKAEWWLSKTSLWVDREMNMLIKDKTIVSCLRDILPIFHGMMDFVWTKKKSIGRPLHLYLMVMSYCHW